MIKEIYWIIEILAIITCVHSLYGKKIKINAITICFMLSDIIYMNLIDKSIVSRNMFFLIYVVFMIYNYLEFGGKIRTAVVQSIVTTAAIAVIQMIVYIPCMLLTGIISDENVIILIVNVITFAIIFLTRKNVVFKKLFKLTTSKNWVMWIFITGGLLWLGYCMYQIKISTIISSDIYAICITLIVAVTCIGLKWQDEYYERKLRDRQLELTQVYDKSLQNLIEMTRKKQHDYKNHIIALQGMKQTAKTPEELIKMQKEYCDSIEDNDKYTKLLNNVNNPILAGFLFGKLTDMEDKGVGVDYEVSIEGSNMDISAYDLNEIIGILLDNAGEAVKELGISPDDSIKLQLHECNDHFDLCVKNISKKYNNAEIEQFFSDKYTSKGKGRGLGLAKIKDYQKKYNFKISVKMCCIDDKDWMSVSISKKA